MIEHVLRQLGAVLLATVLAGTQTVAQTRDPVPG